MEIVTKNLVAQLRDLEVGQTLTFPADRVNSLRATASNYGFQWGRTFTTRRNREARTVTIERVA